jgi:hypothetical protein
VNAEVPWQLRAVVSGEIDEAEVLIRNLADMQPLRAVPLALQSSSGRQREFTAELQLPAEGLYTARLRLGNVPLGTTVLTDTTLMIWAHPPGDGVSPLAFLDLPSGVLDDASVLLNRVLEPHGRTVQVISPMPADPQIYRAMLPHYYDKDALVIWGGGSNRYEVASEELNKFLHHDGRLLVVNRSPHEFDSDTRDLFHIDKVPVAVHDELRSLFLPDSPRLVSPIRPLTLRAPAKPLFTIGDELTGAYVDDGYRVAVVPTSIRTLLEEPYDLFLEKAVGLLMEEGTVATLHGPGQQTGSAFLASPIEQPVSLEAVVRGDRDRADLLVRTLDGDRVEFSIPMNRISFDGEQTLFTSAFEPEENQRYMLTLGLYDHEGEWMLNSSQLGVVGFRSEADLLVWLEASTDAEAIRSILSPFWRRREELLPSWRRTNWGNLPKRLLTRYVEEGKTLFSFSGSSSKERQGIIRRLVQNGAQLALFNPLPNSRSGSYTEDVLRATDESYSSAKPATSEGLLPTTIELPAQQFVNLLPPAIPLLVNEEGRAAGWMVHEEGAEFAVWTLNFKRLEASDIRALVEATLRLFGREEVVSNLELSGKKRVGHTYFAAPGETLTLRANVTQPVATMEAVFWPIGEMASSSTVSMRRTESGSFEADFTIADDRARMVGVRITVDDEIYLASASLRIMPGIPDQHSPAMVVLHDDWPKDRFATSEVRAFLDDLKIPVFIVDQRAEDDAVVSHLLQEGVTEDGVVLWLSEQVREGEIAALRTYLEGGGRLLLASADLGENNTSADFVRDILGVGTMGGKKYKEFTLGGEDKPLRIHYPDLTLTELARPMLRDVDGLIAGAQVDTNGYRAVFLPFEIWDVGMGEIRYGSSRARNDSRTGTFLSRRN